MRKIETPYKYKTPDICRALGVTRMTLYLWEKEGKFTPPRDNHGDRIVTEKQLREIMKAFEPSGVGFWHFLPEKVY
jgi:predicted site-specific integrase-resolvase